MSEQKQPGLLELLEQWEKQGASDAEKTARMRDFLSAKARHLGVPMRGTFELTPLCNLNCKMCYVHMTQHQLDQMDKEVLPTSQWKRIMSEAIDAGMTAALLTGGEALLHPGFDELYLFLQSEGIEINVKTNGLLLDEKRIEFFKKHPPQGLQITLYGSDEESYEKVTGYRCFSKVMESVQRVIDSNLTFRLSITPSIYAKDNLDKLLHYVHSLGVDYVISSGLHNPRKETGREGEQHDISIEDYIQLRQIVMKFSGEKNEKDCMDNAVPTDARHHSKGLRCGGGRDGFAVNWQGQMQPCLMLCHISENLLTVSFASCWEKIHREAVEYPALEECATCRYARRCPYTCVALHFPGGRKGHTDPSFCARTQKLMDACRMCK